MESLIRYNWPGNIRELQNVVERVVVLARGPVVQVDASLMGADEPGEESSSIDTLKILNANILNARSSRPVG